MRYKALKSGWPWHLPFKVKSNGAVGFSIYGFLLMSTLENFLPISYHWAKILAPPPPPPPQAHPYPGPIFLKIGVTSCSDITLTEWQAGLHSVRISLVHTRSIRTASANFQETWCVYVPQTNKQREILVKPKDKIPMEQQSGVVYQLKCDNCDKIYIGETSRSLGTRYKEHTAGRHTRTAVGEHLDNTGHKSGPKEAKIFVILDKEDHVSRRRIKDAIIIHQGRPGRNRDTGLDIPAVILQLVSHDSEGPCDTNGH